MRELTKIHDGRKIECSLTINRDDKFALVVHHFNDKYNLIYTEKYCCKDLKDVVKSRIIDIAREMSDKYALLNSSDLCTSSSFVLNQEQVDKLEVV